MARFWKLIANRAGYKAVALGIAVVSWIVVQGSQHVQVTKEVPLEVTTADDIVPGNDIPTQVSFRLSGPKAFLRAILNRPERPIRVNLSQAKPGLVTYRFFSDNIRLPIGVKVLGIQPNAILINLEKVKRRKVPVRVELTGAPPEGYRVVETRSDPPEVTIRGAKSRVNAVAEVATAPIDVSELKKELAKEATLDLDRLQVSLEGAAPKVTVRARPTSANYRIKNVGVRVLTDHRYKLSRRTVTVLVRASSADLKELKTLGRTKVYAMIDLKGAKKGRYSREVDVKLPENIGFVKAVPEKLRVTLY